MLLHEARRAARVDAQGDVVLLEDQDRALWNKDLLQEGTTLVGKALASQKFGPYTVQAAISAVHAAAANPNATDWPQIVALYDVLLQMEPSPVIELNRAVAVAMRDGPAAGLALIERINRKGGLSGYLWLYSAQADLYRRLGRVPEARAAYEKALSLSEQEPEKRFLEKRLREL
jgi:RNA polymerase sigma-70 factor, ECF subfamily